MCVIVAWRGRLRDPVPPYTPPKDFVYNTNAGPIEGKINVHLVPHTHDDTGWCVHSRLMRSGCSSGGQATVFCTAAIKARLVKT
jgi:hypothetical protein